jgi:hypothetical protein
MGSTGKDAVTFAWIGNAYLLIGLIGVFTIGSTLFTHVYRAFWGEEGIWWTGRRISLAGSEY